MTDLTRGERIGERMHTLRLSTRRLAEAIDVDRRTISRAIQDDPQVRETTYRLIEQGLDELEPSTGVGAEVKRRRERVDLTQQQLADLAEVDRNTIVSIEKGGGFRNRTLLKVTQVLEHAEEAKGLDVTASEPEDVDRLDITITISINGTDLRRILGREL